MLTVFGAVFPQFCPDKHESWHGGADLHFTFIGATCHPRGAKNLFMDYWVKAIPAWHRHGCTSRSHAGNNNVFRCTRACILATWTTMRWKRATWSLTRSCLTCHIRSRTSAPSWNSVILRCTSTCLANSTCRSDLRSKSLLHPQHNRSQLCVSTDTQQTSPRSQCMVLPATWRI